MLSSSLPILVMQSFTLSNLKFNCSLYVEYCNLHPPHLLFILHFASHLSDDGSIMSTNLPYAKFFLTFTILALTLSPFNAPSTNTGKVSFSSCIYTIFYIFIYEDFLSMFKNAFYFYFSSFVSTYPHVSWLQTSLFPFSTI